MTEPSEMEVTNPERLDAIFRAHYERIARVIGGVIHDQARAEELASPTPFLRGERNFEVEIRLEPLSADFSMLTPDGAYRHDY
jgi:hypothetical protein